MNDISLKKIMDSVIAFRDARDWKKFHNPKDITIALQLEVAEVFEHLKWKTNEQFAQYAKKHKKEIAEEVMDVLYNTMLLVHELDIDVSKEFFLKMKKNEKKYPIALYKGKNSFQVKG